MPDVRSSAIRRRLAAELRRLREQSGFSGDDVAHRLGWSGSKVSRIETHRTGVKQVDLDLLLALYQVDEEQRRQMTALAAEQEGRGWWTAYSDALPEDTAAYIGLEADATSVRCWSPELIHGLMQTDGYARAVIEAHMGTTAIITPGEIRRRVEARLRRQEIMTRQVAPQVMFVLDQAVLLRRFGAPTVMAAQLFEVERVSRLANVVLQVLPFAARHPIGTGAFTILSFEAVHGAVLDDVVYVEQLSRSSFVEEEPETYRYRLAFERLSAEALDPIASRQMIAEIARDTWSYRAQ